jgi:NAD(P)-dependent dehydrogenase (short-subunit alcohol dehydrogenase family)
MTAADSDTAADTSVPTNHPASQTGDGDPAELRALTAAPSARGVAVVTGGAAGLGRAVVRELAGAGFDVAILARGHDGVAGAVRDVAAAGHRGLGVLTDVADRVAVESAADQIEDTLGPIEVWVNDAMASVFAPFLDTDPDDFDRAVAVTFGGFVNGTRAALSRMRKRDRGTLIQVGSALAFRGIPLQSAYCASKHAMVGFTESVITELIHDHSRIRVSMVHMPGMNTVQFNWVKSHLPHHPQPVPPIYQPEVGARAVMHAVDHHPRSMWVAAPTIGTILGNRVIPGLLDVYLGRTGVSGQQSAKDDRPEIGFNLWHPVPGDHGAHGDFDQRSLAHSPALFLSEHRFAVLGTLAASAAGAVSVLRRSS